MVIKSAIADIEKLTAAIDFQGFRHNTEKILAVVKAIKIWGEAVKKFLRIRVTAIHKFPEKRSLFFSIYKLCNCRC
ncbi:hypothetical protein [Nostoc sp.]